jgi:hypothetical protein
LTLEEEYDVDRLCEIFEEKRRVVVRAEFAGSGKSYACKHLKNRGHSCGLRVSDEQAVSANHRGRRGWTP